MSELVRVTYNGKIAVITIDNPKKLNALDQDGYYQLAKLMREVATHEEVFITILTGSGTSEMNQFIVSWPILEWLANMNLLGRFFSA